MAVNLKRNNFEINVGAIIHGALESAQRIRSTEVAQKESEFQKAIADGSMSYKAQIAFRQQQLAEDSKSLIPNSDFTDTLTQNIAQLKKLDRFNTYRTKYAE